MINLVLGLPIQVAGAGSASANTQSSALSSQSFESELSEAISDVLSQFGIDPGSVQLTVEDSTGENLGASQNSAGGSNSADPSSTPVTAAPVASAPVAATPVVARSAITAAASTAAAASAPVASPASFDDQYWSNQPPAVQQLRNIQDQGQRTQLGEQLASEGYTIDVPIMVWGWDPSTTTQLRQSYGYTWVPSALQPPVESAPGITDPGLTPYDPNHPPAGSIAV